MPSRFTKNLAEIGVGDRACAGRSEIIKSKLRHAASTRFGSEARRLCGLYYVDETFRPLSEEMTQILKSKPASREILSSPLMGCDEAVDALPGVQF